MIHHRDTEDTEKRKKLCDLCGIKCERGGRWREQGVMSRGSGFPYCGYWKEKGQR